MEDDKDRVVEPALGKLLRLAWGSGGGWEKLLAMLVVLAYPVLLVIVFIEVSRMFHAGWPMWIMGAFLLGLSSLVFFTQSMVRPLYGRRALRILDQRGWGPARPGYYAELARYVQRYGQDGRLPWVVLWGIASWLLFYGFIVLGVWLSLVLNSLLGVWTLLPYVALIYPLGFLWWLAYRRRIHKMEETENGVATTSSSRPHAMLVTQTVESERERFPSAARGALRNNGMPTRRPG